jgi:hypothetical protein
VWHEPLRCKLPKAAASRTHSKARRAEKNEAHAIAQTLTFHPLHDHARQFLFLPAESVIGILENRELDVGFGAEGFG